MPSGTNNKYYKSRTKTNTVKCRVCLASCLAQNYQAHLKSQHPMENSSNLHRHGEGSLNFNFQPQRNDERSNSPENSRSRSPVTVTVSCSAVLNIHPLSKTGTSDEGLNLADLGLGLNLSTEDVIETPLQDDYDQESSKSDSDNDNMVEVNAQKQ